MEEENIEDNERKASCREQNEKVPRAQKVYFAVLRNYIKNRSIHL